MTNTEALEMLRDIPITDTAVCSWIKECRHPAIRLAVFYCGDRQYRLAYLCDHHKQMGQWSDEETAFGWD